MKIIDKDKLIKDFYDNCNKYDCYCNNCPYKEIPDCMGHYIIDKINKSQLKEQNK